MRQLRFLVRLEDAHADAAHQRAKLRYRLRDYYAPDPGDPLNLGQRRGILILSICVQKQESPMDKVKIGDQNSEILIEIWMKIKDCQKRQNRY